MKKFILAILCLLGLIFVPKFFSELNDDINAISAIEELGSVTFLVVGFDNAAMNTDSIMICNIDGENNGISILQLPRDTYNKQSETKKINGIFPTSKMNGLDDAGAMGVLAHRIGSDLGIKIDYYLGITTDAFIYFIDAIGGVTVDMPNGLVIKSGDGDVKLSLEKGSNTIDGSDALRFVRHRESYNRADIERLDAQKIFIEGLLSSIDITDMLGLVPQLKSIKNKGVITNVSLNDISKIGKIICSRNKSFDLMLATAPGDAFKEKDGKWYYYLSCPSLHECLDRLGFSYNDMHLYNFFDSDSENSGEIFNNKVHYTIENKSIILSK